jgi:hypothetical protein
VPAGTDRDRILAAVLADPPVVHPMGPGTDPTMGVWSTDEECYRLLAAHVEPGTRTLETGCGLSTILFAALGAEHVCCTPGAEERDRLLAHCESRGIDPTGLSFRLDSSHVSLPLLAAEGRSFDVFLIDGGHGYPLPIVDWFHGASMLRRGGLLVVDDANLPAVRELLRFLDRDPRWQRLERRSKWSAYRRLSDGPLAEDWFEQPFHQTTADRVRRRAIRWHRRAARLVARMRSRPVR